VHTLRLCLCLSLVSLAGCVGDSVTVVADAGAADSPMLPLGCDVPVAAGEFTLQMVGLLHAHGGFRFELARDGSFTGNVPISWEYCEGTITAAESESLAAAANAAFAFCRLDLLDCRILERDNTYEDVAIQTTDLSRENRFCHVECFSDRDEPMSAFFNAALAPMWRVYEAGACTRSTYVPPAATARCPSR